MPIYGFECLDCGAEYDKLVLTSKDIIECPKCKSTSYQRTMTAPGHYKIEGPNDASVTPKKFRGES